MTYLEKKDYIISKGWTTLWSDTNWINRSFMTGNIDWQGMDLESAYECQLKRDKL